MTLVIPRETFNIQPALVGMRLADAATMGACFYEPIAETRHVFSRQSVVGIDQSRGAARSADPQRLSIFSLLDAERRRDKDEPAPFSSASVIASMSSMALGASP